MKPLVSVIIPAHNRCDLLLQAIRSVEAQTYDNWEVLIIDDGSVDPVHESVQPLLAQNISYHRQMNQGASVARNLGIQLAKGEYLSFLDSDDMYETTCLEDKVRLAKEFHHAGVIGGGCRYVDYDGNPVPPDSPPRASVTYEDLAIWTAYPGGTNNIFAKRDLLLDIGGFRTNLSDSEDRDILRRLAERTSIASVPGTTAIVRAHTTPRHNRDYASLVYSRKWVTSQINGNSLRKASAAWNEHIFGVLKWQSGARVPAIFHWIYSFLIHPAAVHHELSRSRDILNLLLPARLHGVVARLKLIRNNQ